VTSSISQLEEKNLSGMGELLLELNPELCAVKPDNLACLALAVCQCELELRGNAIGGLHLETGSGLREIPDCARNAPAAEKNLPGFQHPQPLGRSALFHALAREEMLPSVTGRNFQKINVLFQAGAIDPFMRKR
jgi:hypothetical protein